MKRFITLLFCLPVFAFAQPFDFSKRTLNFPDVNYLDQDSLKLTLTNTSGYDISVIGIDMFSVYGTEPFYVKDSIFTMVSGADYEVWVYFMPEQNILHQLNAVVRTDFRGDYLIGLTGEGHFANSYFSDSYNKREEDLKASLKSITGQGYNSYSYSAARDEMYGNIDNVNGDVECVYTGRVATFSTRPGANSNSFNCEHTFPQGFFSQNLPMRSDIHHLFPTDVTSNSQRGNYEFGVVTGNPSWTQGGSKKGSDGSNTVFEPRDIHKGAVARALFYFVLRYQDYSNHVQGQESTLRSWMDMYPPTAWDIQRNNDIYAFQNNRNPFVDYPQFIKRITKISGNSSAVSNPDLYVSRTAIDMTGETDSTLFTISLMNTGNVQVLLSDFSISETTNFDFENSQSDRILFPGEGYEIEVRVTPTITAAVAEVLSFDTDIPGMGTIDIDLTGGWSSLNVKSFSNNASFNVYPNPANDQVSISWEGHLTYEVKVYDLRGEKIMTRKVVNGKDVIALSSFAKGMYIIEVSNDDEVIRSSVVVE
jgi:hypothetical protein